MGQAVYLARQPELDRMVAAVKILPPEVASGDPDFMERFTREARSLPGAAQPSQHRHHLRDFGETDGLYYFTMEYVDGKNVRELLARPARSPSRWR